MHILDYLKAAGENILNDENSVIRFEYRLEKDSIRVEYRLICSGMFYPAHFMGDWSHSDSARILLSLPVELLVAGRPYDDYPQELALRFVAPLVHEEEGCVSHSYYPDVEIASDFAALCTLLCRRLVTTLLETRRASHRDLWIRDHVVQLISCDTLEVRIRTFRVLHTSRSYRPMRSIFVLDEGIGDVVEARWPMRWIVMI